MYNSFSVTYLYVNSYRCKKNALKVYVKMSYSILMVCLYRANGKKTLSAVVDIKTSVCQGC